MRFIIVLTLPFFLLNSGCTALKRPTESTPILNEIKQTGKNAETLHKHSIESQLLVAAQSIEQSLLVLAAAEKSESTPLLNTAPLITPEGGLGGLVDVDWTGPLGPLVEKIAELGQYRVKFLGNEPAIPVLITLTAKRTALADVLQNASLQAGKKAQVLVFPEAHVIEVRYAS